MNIWWWEKYVYTILCVCVCVVCVRNSNESQNNNKELFSNWWQMKRKTIYETREKWILRFRSCVLAIYTSSLSRVDNNAIPLASISHESFWCDVDVTVLAVIMEIILFTPMFAWWMNDGDDEFCAYERTEERNCEIDFVFRVLTQWRLKHIVGFEIN